MWSGSRCLVSWVDEHLDLYLAILQRRLALETDEAEVLILVRYLAHPPQPNLIKCCTYFFLFKARISVAEPVPAEPS